MKREREDVIEGGVHAQQNKVTCCHEALQINLQGFDDNTKKHKQCKSEIIKKNINSNLCFVDPQIYGIKGYYVFHFPRRLRGMSQKKGGASLLIIKDLMKFKVQ